MTPSPPQPIALVVHGHFYQPPRENPWTDEIAREPSAAPAHDWNARIHAECYRANAFARIHNSEGRIEAIVNNYARLSFNFGPTLARWIERHDGRTHARLQVADAEQRRRLGHGGALAQAYAHPIVPLCNAQDRHTQLLWGLSDFRRRFGRDAGGLWLPETAVSPQTLEELIELGVKFTILAPEQIAAVRAPNQAAWTKVNRDTIDSGRAYRWVHRDGSGRSIDLAIFDGPLSRAVAFGDAATRAETFLDSVHASAERSSVTGQRMVLCASDGELFGHHKKFADLTLAFANFVGAQRRGIEVTNLGAYLERHPPTWLAELAEGPDGEGTAWSCGHGLGRWRRNCGCSMAGPELGWSQAWRAPLREALDVVRDAAGEFFEDAAASLLIDPWAARNAYGDVVDDAIPIRDRLLATFARPALARGGDAARARARLLLELQRGTLLMYASCGWFFDDIAGLESSLVIRMAAHALDLYRQAGGHSANRGAYAKIVADVTAILANAKSNRPEEGTGADVFRRVAGDRVTARWAIAHVTMARLIEAQTASVFPGSPATGDVSTPGFTVAVLRGTTSRAPAGPALTGRARAVQQRTGASEEHDFWAIVRKRKQEKETIVFECRVGGKRYTLTDLGADERDGLIIAALPLLLEEPRDLGVIRAALETARIAGKTGNIGLRDGLDDRARRRIFAAMLIDLLSEKRGQLGPEALALAVDLYDAAEMGPSSVERRIVEEMVWDHVDAGAPSGDLARLARRLGFAADAAPPEAAVS
ncbi:MAG TPA: DUF3536 domain-containing protein [Polyangia bacterium]|nr:DUF3536 domain-containing protein [Polyangia bacterium]